MRPTSPWAGGSTGSPFSSAVPADWVFRVSPEEYRANLTRFIELSRVRGIECVLLTRPFLGESSDESHFNERGHRKAAKLIFDQIVPLLE